MEDASKALIMSASILIGIIILSIAVYLFSAFGGTSKEIQQQVDSRVLAEFNNNFTKYLGSETCTIHDIVNLANFAQKTNREMGYEPTDSIKPYYIKVILIDSGRKDLTQCTEQEWITLLNDKSVQKDDYGNLQGSLQYYRCEEIRYDNAEEPNRVSSIIFKKI